MQIPHEDEQVFPLYKTARARLHVLGGGGVVRSSTGGRWRDRGIHEK